MKFNDSNRQQKRLSNSRTDSRVVRAFYQHLSIRPTTNPRDDQCPVQASKNYRHDRAAPPWQCQLHVAYKAVFAKGISNGIGRAQEQGVGATIVAGRNDHSISLQALACKVPLNLRDVRRGKIRGQHQNPLRATQPAPPGTCLRQSVVKVISLFHNRAAHPSPLAWPTPSGRG